MSFARTCSRLVPDITFTPDAKKDNDGNDFLTRV